jgi:glutamate-1-semialdehyde 2,1-aminomutase
LRDTITFPYNDLDAVQEKMKGIKEKLACIIVEPFLGAGGFIPPEQGFLEGLREITREHGIILIFDEVISGFRLAPGGAAEYYGVKPDLSTFGKALSNGFPLAAIGGRADILDLMNPLVTTEPKKRVAHSGTFCANPVAMVAGIATLDQLKDGTYQKTAEAVGKRVRANLRAILDGRAHVVGTHCTTAVFFTKKPPKNPADVFAPENMKKLLLLNTALLTKNIYFIDGMRGHVLPVHTDEQLDRLFEVTREFVKKGMFD